MTSEGLSQPLFGELPRTKLVTKKAAVGEAWLGKMIAVAKGYMDSLSLTVLGASETLL